MYCVHSCDCVYLESQPSVEHLLLGAFDVSLICILKAIRGREGLVIILNDSVYVSVGAVEADRLDKVSDWPGEIYCQRLTVNIHLVVL